MRLLEDQGGKKSKNVIHRDHISKLKAGRETSIFPEAVSNNTLNIVRWKIIGNAALFERTLRHPLQIHLLQVWTGVFAFCRSKVLVDNSAMERNLSAPMVLKNDCALDTSCCISVSFQFSKLMVVVVFLQREKGGN